MIHVALFEPEIPPNTGNAIRLCANVAAPLHLIHPLGFSLDSAKLRRAGLDYREMANVIEHRDWSMFRTATSGRRVWAFTTKAQRSAFAPRYQADDILLFGPETRGLPETIRSEIGTDFCVRLPMRAGSRSLNLSNSVAVAVYEAWRQLDFCGAGGTSK